MGMVGSLFSKSIILLSSPSQWFLFPATIGTASLSSILKTLFSLLGWTRVTTPLLSSSKNELTPIKLP